MTVAVLTRNLSRAVTDLKQGYGAKFIAQRKGRIYAADADEEFLICIGPKDLHGQTISRYIMLPHCETGYDFRAIDEMEAIAKHLIERGVKK